MEQAVASKNADEVARIYATDATFMAPNMPTSRGQANIRGTWAEFLRLPNVSLSLSPTKIDVASSGDVALRTGSVRSVTGPAPLLMTTWISTKSQLVRLAEAFVSAPPDEVSRRKRELVETLKPSAWRPAGEPVALFYDPPFALPFLRRNEVAVPVEPARRAEPAGHAASSASA